MDHPQFNPLIIKLFKLFGFFKFPDDLILKYLLKKRVYIDKRHSLNCRKKNDVFESIYSLYIKIYITFENFKNQN